MKLPYSWIKELIPQLPPVTELEPIFAQLGLPLEGIDESPAPPAGVLLAAVQAAEPMPGTQLTRLTLDVGPQGTQTVATGAANAVGLPVGTVVALVTPGTTLGEMTYGVREMQGVQSWGMCASAKELGIGESNAGILTFPAGTAQPGTPMHQLWPVDSVLDIEVTPNRADVLSALGLCRDLAAFLKLDLKEPIIPAAPTQPGEISISLPPKGRILERDPQKKVRFGSDHFAARAVSGVQNGPSPLWMQRRVSLAGMRPIDLIVDTSNYVMLELGQPTALYDRRDVANDRLVVAFGLRGGELVKDLLGNTHQMGPEDLLILDGAMADEPVMTVADAFSVMGEPKQGSHVLGVAGIVGSDHGHVRADTRDVVVEAAHFDPVLLRLTATRLGLKTDAVYRYERGVDPLLAPKAAVRVAELLREYGGATPEAGQTLVGTPELPADITTTGDQIRKLLGMQIDTAEMRDILTRLGCAVAGEGDHLSVTPPSWRVDMLIWQDLAEEVARLHGFVNLPETLPHLRVHDSNLGASAPSENRANLRRVLSGLGFQEAVTYTFTSDDEAQKARTEAPNVRLRNPMTAERTGMRTALYPSLLGAAGGYGKGERALLFELGRIFPAAGETERLGLLMRGDLAAKTYQDGVRGGFSVFKGLVQSFASALGASFELEQAREGDLPAALHPGIAGHVLWNGQKVGWLGALHPEIAADFGLKGDTFILEVALPLPGREWAFTDPSRAPAAWRDLAVIAPQSVSYGEIVQVLQGAGDSILESVEPFDVFTGEQVGAGNRSVAVRMTYRDAKTLTDEEVEPVFAAQIAAVRAKGWDIRDK
ncbi:phenylalanine--tRNA ligase subunit beta [Deinococcus sp.]|uniref:phenylalanine--tRNA ligase subunit beta n=1 Tax=Deinococcus sp. TaxID=47478 RepID=UPI0025BE7E62|nr:phenylalanine--tRNA ligase subunit beta [Deinococcus sp.]